MTKSAETVKVFADVGADISGVEIRKRGKRGEGALVAGFQIGRSIQEEDALTLEDAEAAAASAEGFTADSEADLFGKGEEFIESGLEVHGRHIDYPKSEGNGFTRLTR